MSGINPTPFRGDFAPAFDPLSAAYRQAMECWGFGPLTREQAQKKWGLKNRYKSALFRIVQAGAYTQLGNVRRDLDASEVTSALGKIWEFIGGNNEDPFQPKKLAIEHWNAFISTILYVNKKRIKNHSPIFFKWDNWKALRDAAKVCS